MTLVEEIRSTTIVNAKFSRNWNTKKEQDQYKENLLELFLKDKIFLNY